MDSRYKIHSVIFEASGGPKNGLKLSARVQNDTLATQGLPMVGGAMAAAPLSEVFEFLRFGRPKP